MKHITFFAIGLLTALPNMGLAADKPEAACSDPASLARYRLMKEILDEANRRSTAGASEREVLAFISTRMRRTHLFADVDIHDSKGVAAERGAEADETPPPAWDAYGRASATSAKESVRTPTASSGPASTKSAPITIQVQHENDEESTYKLDGGDR